MKQIFLKLLLYTVFILYIVVLFGLLFLKARDFTSVNLVPFYSIGHYLFSDDPLLRAFAFSNVVGNIVLFIPLGIYLPLFTQQKSITKNVVWIVAISAAVEILQFIFKVGATDIDDVILNGLGGYIGVLTYQLLLKLVADAEKVKLFVTLGAPFAAICSVIGIIMYNS